MIDLGRSCARFRPVLEDFVDRGEVRSETGAALAHLDGCERCTEAIESTMLTITALRRLGDEASTVEPPSDAWPRLRVRITSWRRRPRVMSPIAGVGMSLAIVAVLVLPFRLGGTGFVDPTLRPSTADLTSAELATSPSERAVETAFLARQRSAAGISQGDESKPVLLGNYRRTYPDNYHPVRKEVDPPQAGGRSPRAI